MSLTTLAARLQYQGGNALGRINQQKLNSLRAALKNDYNSRLIKTPLHTAWPALINLNNLKPDYDKKYISVEYDAGLEPGDVFEILDDCTHWMVYLPLLTETAYLHSEIIRCRYTITIDDTEYWIYFQGPTETDIRWFQKRGININELNLSGTIFIKLNKQTREFFERFTHIKVDGHIWEVQVTDSISVPGILEIEVQEYYDNPVAELPEIKKTDDIESVIVGETTVPQDTTIGYYIPKAYVKNSAEWSVTGNPRVDIVEVMNNGNMCKVRIHDGAIGTYIIHYGDYELEVTIDWQRNYINGPDKVAPYGIYTYEAEGTFSVDSSLVRINSQDGTKCELEVLTGRKGNFTLTCVAADETVYTLPIAIGSFTGDKNEKSIGIVS